MRSSTSTTLTLLLVLGALCVLFAVPATNSLAQTTAMLDRVVLDINPSNPGPFEDVQVRVKSYAMDVDNSTVTWIINGEEYASGPAFSTITVTTGAVGSATTIEVQVRDPNNGLGETFRILRPAFVSLLWEGDSYTPPLYKGLALHGPETSVRVVAEPLFVDGAGTRIDPDRIKYQWYVNRTLVDSQSGTGRRALTVTKNPKFVRDLEVRVVASSLDGSISAGRTIEIPVAEQEVHLYEVHPLQGVLYEQALLGEYRMTQSETELVAEPYYLSANTREDVNMDYAWELNRNPILARGRITVRPEGNGAGTAQLELLVRNTETLLQVAKGDLRIAFTTEERERGFFTREQ